MLGRLKPAARGALISVLLFTYRDSGWAGVKTLLERPLDSRLGAFLYLVVLLLFPLHIGGSLWLVAAIGDPVPDMPRLANKVTTPIDLCYPVLGLTAPGGVQLALVRARVACSTRSDAAVSCLSVGVLWGDSLPPIFMPHQEVSHQQPIWSSLLIMTRLAFHFAWLHRNAHRSLLSVLLFHTTFNLSRLLYPELGSDHGGLHLFILMPVSVGRLEWIGGRQRMMRRARQTYAG